jgi:hypothetical protein
MVANVVKVGLRQRNMQRAEDQQDDSQAVQCTASTWKLTWHDQFILARPPFKPGYSA